MTPMSLALILCEWFAECSRKRLPCFLHFITTTYY